MSDYQDWSLESLVAVGEVQIAKYNLDPRPELLQDIGSITIALITLKDKLGDQNGLI
jgi:hypothetical protein